MQLSVLNSPFNQEQAELLNRLLPTLTESQKLWICGFLAASQSASQTYAAQSVPQAAATLELLEKIESPVTELEKQETLPSISNKVTILYGSQSGNAQGMAKKVGQTLEGRGLEVTVSSMSDFKPNQLKKVQNLLLVVSTHGDGEPPDNAISFHEFLHGKRAPKLDELHYSVLALGDQSYDQFCQTGKDFDKRLQELGASPIYPRVDCDVDYDEQANKWLEGILAFFSENETNSSASAGEVKAVISAQASNYSRQNPFKAEVLENLNLNGRGSNKETRHLELSLEGSGFTYEPGDALGIYPENDPALVELLLQELHFNASEKVAVNQEGEVLPLKEALTTYFEITALTKVLLQNAANLTGNKELQELVSSENKENLKEYMAGRDLLDLVRNYGPWDVTAQQFVSILRKIPARLYSISSSFAANPEEVHVTIGAVRYEAHGREHKGVCSCYAAERLEPGDKISVFVQSNGNFKLPENPETPIIMIGPGTGVAPFRSFMQEREEQGAQGKSWMFFGDQHFVTDFLYQTEWQKWLKDGVLTRMDVAFSRDTEEKIYVQHRLLERSKEVYQWLEEGAVLFICGDKDRMARDVENTLVEIIEKESGSSREQAAAYLNELKQQKRYQRDVY
ncbi:assimilatory sulfite reductase (NADPH) flavoprotein subunit [Bacillus benzoevorans]|uniref:assimilatory sulfite reductase (NADPH) n=1 Tax=Bacillus benzoevorans TaxID=1456 RepID=A0A7X0HNE3_9BACI|nr:assimilatory sulfite reductase (NADPH) flavoprotein subunit [Bacillus benzoevorans]MBB6443904.1 sulfite reductase (NADPH) flavoprotein alpha-component [Bacillus benzoevorans]